jgi:streptogramin lyase
MKDVRSKFTALLTALAVLSAAGCGGGSQGGSVLSQTGSVLPSTGAGASGPTVSATIRIAVPSALAAIAKRRPQYISPTTQGLLIRAYVDNNGAQGQLITQVAASLTPVSPNCSGSGTSLACTATIAVPAGNTIFVFTTYSVQPTSGSFGSATPIGAAVVTQDIVANQANVVSVDLGGVVVTVKASLSTTQVDFVPPATSNLTLTFYDTNNNPIVSGPYVDQNGNPITVALSATEDANSSVVVPSGSLTAGVPQTVKYTGLAANPFTSTITATLSDGPTATAALTVQPIQFSFYPIPAGSQPYSITNGPDGALWYGTSAGVYRLTTAGVQTGPFGNYSTYGGITTGPNGALWTVGGELNGGSIDQVGQITTSGAGTTYSLPTSTTSLCDSYLDKCIGYGITTGPDGAMWATETGGAHAVYRVSSSGSVTTYPFIDDQEPGKIIAGPAGSNVMYLNYCNDPWYADVCGIASVSTSGTFTLIGPGTYFNIYNLVLGSDGNIWFSEGEDNQQVMTRMTPSGQITGQYSLPSNPMGLVDAMTTNPDTAIWVGSYSDDDAENCQDTDDFNINELARVMTNGSIWTAVIPLGGGVQCYGWVQDAVSGSDGAVWFVYMGANGSNAIGRAI